MKELIEFLRELAGKRLGLDRDLMNRAALVIESQAATIALYETTAENCDVLRAKVDEQAREIERLTRKAANCDLALAAQTHNLFALKAQPSGVVPEELFDGFAVYSAMTDQAKRRTSGENVSDALNAVVKLIRARLNSSPVSAGDDEYVPAGIAQAIMHSEEVDATGGLAAQIRKAQAEVATWPADIREQNGISAGVVDERVAFEAAYSREYGTPLSVLRLLREGDAYIEKPQHSDRLNSSWWMWKQARAALTASAPAQDETATPTVAGWLRIDDERGAILTRSKCTPDSQPLYLHPTAYRVTYSAPSHSEQVRERLAAAIPYLRHAVSDAEKSGVAQLAVVSTHQDGSGRIVCRFDCAEFMSDVAVVVGVGPQTEEDTLRAEARQFLDKHGIAAPSAGSQKEQGE